MDLNFTRVLNRFWFDLWRALASSSHIDYTLQDIQYLP